MIELLLRNSSTTVIVRNKRMDTMANRIATANFNLSEMTAPMRMLQLHTTHTQITNGKKKMNFYGGETYKVLGRLKNHVKRMFTLFNLKEPTAN